MLSIDCKHPDLEEFITVKSDLDKITKANISVRITDEFMEAVKNDQEYELEFVREETGEEIRKTVNARKIFHKLAEMNWDMAEPGVLYWDRIKDWNLLSNDPDFEYAGVNPCVSGDTLILTENGYVKIKDVVGKEIKIWNGYQYSKVNPRITGHNQKMKRIYLSDGSTVDCTYYHKFILNNGDRVEAQNLNIGDKLVKHYFPIIEGENSIPTKIAYTQGFFMGDGYSDSKRNRKFIYLYGEKQKLRDYLTYDKIYDQRDSSNRDCLCLPFEPDYDKQFVPGIEYDIKSRLAWLAGYIDSDGTIQSKEGGVSISSVNKDVLLKVKLMLNTLGCNGKVTLMKSEREETMPKNDGTGESSMYHCKESYRILISSNAVRSLLNLGLDLHRVKVSPTPNRDASQFIKVVDIEDIENCEEVYCFNEPLNHSAIFNGVITAQCAEEPLPAGGSCLLGSINLSEFVLDPYTQKARFDFDQLKDTVGIAVEALNEVLDEGLSLHPLEIQRETVRDWRQIGLGVFGIADMLIKCEIRYGSEESLELCRQIANIIIKGAILTSNELTVPNGTFPKCDARKIIETPFYQNAMDGFPPFSIERDGLRNSQLLTIAPTGSLSTMLRVSGGIEPFFARSWQRKTESLHGEDVYYTERPKAIQELMEAKELNSDAELPDYVVVSEEINPMDRLDMQATWQRYIDASISSTINLPNHATIEDVENIYMAAWEKGLKGVTVYRDGCRRSGILTTTKNDDEPQDQELKRGDIICADDDVVGKKRKLTTGCGSLHCTAFFDPITGDLLETYLSKGSTGGCNNFMIGLSRMISTSARGGVGIDAIVDQLESCGTCPSYAVRTAIKKDTSKGACCPTAVAYALRDMWNEMRYELGLQDSEEEAARQSSSDIDKELVAAERYQCPECGEKLYFEGGCNVCKSCGWSKCE